MLKNYTSKVPANTSLAYIERKLVQHGATRILKTYDSERKRVTAMCFAMEIDGVDVHFRLPARVANCEQVLRANLTSRSRPETIKKMPAQAERTAWKIVLDWVEAQMAMIELAQIEVMEVFMPYVFDGKQTYYELIKEKGYKALLPGSKQ
ncbi:unnamed protein product [marine sediment metagenome]|uniref:Uncharacterized protein n=1 Tax=marine sediment metagenome TaxID=412755 RepID=X0TFX3_9ZZZZ